MLCYRDMSFCSAAPQCKNAESCHRYFDRHTRAKADLWAISMGMFHGDEPAPLVAYVDFSKSCPSYEVKNES